VRLAVYEMKTINENKNKTLNYFRSVIKKNNERNFFIKRASYWHLKQKTFDDNQLATKLFWKWIKQKGLCAYTGRKLKYDNTTHIDHIIPRSKGGTNHPDNFQFICDEANYAKNNLSHNQFMQLVTDIMNYKIKV